MKKVSGWVSSKPFGYYNFEFYVDDNTTDKEIKEMVDKAIELRVRYKVEEEYEYTEIKYRKADTFEYY